MKNASRAKTWSALVIGAFALIAPVIAHAGASGTSISGASCQPTAAPETLGGQGLHRGPGGIQYTNSTLESVVCSLPRINVGNAGGATVGINYIKGVTGPLYVFAYNMDWLGNYYSSATPFIVPSFGGGTSIPISLRVPASVSFGTYVVLAYMGQNDLLTSLTLSE